jgi:hypothetical protein
VDDPPSEFTERIRHKVESHRGRLEEQGIDCTNLIKAELLALDQKIRGCLETALSEVPSGGAVELWLDITSLPKRFFFLLVKLALMDERIDTLLVTYTQPAPAGYTAKPLAFNPDVVKPLPGFALQSGEADTIVVAVGFEALGLRQLLEDFRDRKRRVVLLIPFPPGQPYTRRIWQTIIRLGYTREQGYVWRISALDSFDVFRHLERLADPDAEETRRNPPALAPYGPKPMSLGMCLYAIRCQSPVFYTQPRAYHPDYTTGIGQKWAYCIKARGVVVRPQAAYEG